MFKILVFVLIPITLILLGIFVDGLMDLYKKEKDEEDNLARDGIEGYLDETLGYKRVTIFKSVTDSEGIVTYSVYLPKYEWFKSPHYQWYEVYATNNGFAHREIEG